MYTFIFILKYIKYIKLNILMKIIYVYNHINKNTKNIYKSKIKRNIIIVISKSDLFIHIILNYIIMV